MNIDLKHRHPALRWKRVKRALRLFRRPLRENAGTMLAALSCGIGVALMELARPWPIKAIFDGLLIPQAGDGAGWLSTLGALPTSTAVLIVCAAVLVIAVLWGVLSYGQTYLTARAGQSLVFSLRRRTFTHLQGLSLAYHRNQRRGDLLMRLMGDINVLRDLLVNSLLRGVSAVLLLVLMTVVLLLIDWHLSLIVLAILPLLALTTLRFSIKVREATRRQRQSEGRVGALAQEALSGISYLQASGTQEHVERRFARINRSSHKAGLRTTRLEAAQARIIEVLLACGTAAVLGYGVHRVLGGHITPGDLLIFMAYVQSALRPMRQLARTMTRASKAVVCAERLIEVLEAVPAVQDAPGAKSAKALQGEVRFRNVSFSYEDGTPALRNVSFEIGPGETLAIVGPSGSGKSTLLALLMRLYEPSSGRISVDGRNITRFRVQSLREQISVVLQETVLFGSTVRENIGWGRPDATPEEIEEAARKAGADKFIRALQQGYDTPLAEAGASLSGGQRQRLAIARAFLRDAPILVLDEPTFGLDAKAEAHVADAVARLARGRTTFLVAHRLTLVTGASRIIVLYKGKVAESGTHAELLAAGGWYAAAWSAQCEDSERTPSAALTTAVVRHDG
jgi:ATP-binding cassette, subfamily B, bacterial